MDHFIWALAIMCGPRSHCDASYPIFKIEASFEACVSDAQKAVLPPGAVASCVADIRDSAIEPTKGKTRP